MTLRWKPHICFLECSLFKPKREATADQWGVTWACGRWSLQWGRWSPCHLEGGYFQQQDIRLQTNITSTAETLIALHMDNNKSRVTGLSTRNWALMKQLSLCCTEEEQREINEVTWSRWPARSLCRPAWRADSFCKSAPLTRAQKSGATGSNFYWFQI